MRIALSADHAGFEMKDQLADWLRADGYEVVDLGTNGPESVDYPRFGTLLSEALANGRADRGWACTADTPPPASDRSSSRMCRCARSWQRIPPHAAGWGMATARPPR